MTRLGGATPLVHNMGFEIPSASKSLPPIDHLEAVPSPLCLAAHSTKTPPTVQPFLGLCAKLSQAFASYTVIFLIISAYRLFQTRSSVDTFVLDAKQTLFTDCYTLEKTATTLASFPQFAAQSVNRGLIATLDTAISQIGYGLVVVLSGVLATLDFVIGLLTGTWRCFLNNLADSGIPVLSEVGQGGVQAIDQVDNTLLDLLALPLNDLGKVIQDRMADPQIGLVLNMPTIPVQKVVLCDKVLGLVDVDAMAEDLKRWILYGTLVVLTLAVVAMLCNMAWIAFRHRRWTLHVSRVLQQVETISKEATSVAIDPSGNHEETKSSTWTPKDSRLCAVRIDHLTRHPLLYRFLEASSRCFFPRDENARGLYFWFMFYITQSQAVVCLCVGILGLLMIYAQLTLLDYARAHYRPLLNTALVDLSVTVPQLVNGIMHTSSVAFATETNTALSSLESDLNTHVFSGIVNAAASMSAALVNVETTLVQGIQTVFGDTLFAKLILAVIQCLLLNKLAAVEAGLAWIQGHVQLALPRLEDDVLMMNPTELQKLVAAAVEEMAPPSLFNGVSMNSNNSTGGVVQSKVYKAEIVIGRVFQQYEDELRRELPMYYGLVAVWWAVLAMGIVGVGGVLVRQRRDIKNPAVGSRKDNSIFLHGKETR
ncbi:hypothetical protein BC939DRAFT_435205 [Gamsiella multidivaricata]|uniref:uncharacterized protein n=1 Tax=Gamsiella multidivaricata TaxID=101098 RepID=UPI00221E829C|nr:uncharacterized protein BC939DRAFT_435205 [Gamsiella multidivaricata]KAI7832327.1 hypothetical protein BC939DRAFT_435205 [Gamsiella multidivaricata]